MLRHAERVAQCLIFAPTNKRQRAATMPPSSSEQPDIIGYALLAKSFVSERPEVLDFFSHGDIQVVTDDEDLTNFRTAVENGRLGIREIRLEPISHDESAAQSRNAPSPFIVQASKHDGGVAQLLRRCDIYVHRFHGNFGNPFISAIDEDSLKILKNVLPYRMEVSYLHARGGTILHFAVKRGEGALVDLLLEKELSVNAQQLDSLTPLHLAAMNGYLDITEKLLQCGANINARATFKNFKDCTPLVLAIRYGHLEIFKRLLSITPDVNFLFKSSFGTSLLELAVEQLHCLDFIESILEYRPNVKDKRHRRALLSALCYRGRNRISLKHCVQRMLQYGFSVDYEQVKDPNDLLLGAVHKDCIEIIRMSLEMGADVNARNSNGEYPILIAVKSNCFNTAQLLLLNGANVRDDSKVIYVATKAGNLKVIELLLINGASLNSGNLNESPVHAAAVGGNVQLLEALFNYGAQLCPEFISSFLTERGHGRFDICWVIRQPNILQVLLDQNFTNTQFITTSKLFYFFDRPFPAVATAYLFSFDNFQIFANILARHIIKQRSANLSIFDQNVASIWYSQESIDDFQNACEAEMAMMKLEKVCFSDNDEVGEGRTTVTFYDILMSKQKQLAGYAKNETIVKAMETEDYKVRFPIFADTIKCQFQKGYHRAKLLKQGIKIVNYLFRNNPIVASKKINLEIILDYLSSCDLLSLKKVVPFGI